jgi:ABC-type transport system involved in Fe-S cluster assembly fused permease/ATPase subunit
LIIAHRLSTVRYADEILVLKEGQLLEQGTHETLLNKAGHYAELWKWHGR